MSPADTKALPWTCCAQCGFDVQVDEDGCCVTCGCDALQAHGGPDPRLASPPLAPEVVAVLEAVSKRRAAWDAFILDRMDDVKDETYSRAFEREDAAANAWIAAGRPGLLPAGKEGKG